MMRRNSAMQLKKNDVYAYLYFYPHPDSPLVSNPKEELEDDLVPDFIEPCLYLHMTHSFSYLSLQQLLMEIDIQPDDCSKHVDENKSGVHRFTLDQHMNSVLEFLCENDWIQEEDKPALLAFKNKIKSPDVLFALKKSSPFTYMQALPEALGHQTNQIRLFLPQPPEEASQQDLTPVEIFFKTLNISADKISEEKHHFSFRGQRPYSVFVLADASSIHQFIQYATEHGLLDLADIKKLLDYHFLSIEAEKWNGELKEDSPFLEFAEPPKPEAPVPPPRPGEPEEKAQEISPDIHAKAAFQAIELKNIDLLTLLMGDGVTQQELKNHQEALQILARGLPEIIEQQYKIELYTSQQRYLDFLFKQKEPDLEQQKLAYVSLKQCLVDAAEATFSAYISLFDNQKGAYIHNDKRTRYSDNFREIEQWLCQLLASYIKKMLEEFNKSFPQNSPWSDLKFFLEAISRFLSSASGSFESLGKHQMTVRNKVVQPLELNIDKKRSDHEALIDKTLSCPSLLPSVYQEFIAKPEVLKWAFMNIRLSPDLLNEAGESLLYHVLVRKDLTAAKILLNAGANLELQINQNGTAYERSGISKDILTRIKSSDLQLSTLKSEFQQTVRKILDDYEKILAAREKRAETSRMWRFLENRRLLEERRKAVEGYHTALSEASATYDDTRLADVIKTSSPKDKTLRGGLGRSRLHDGLAAEEERYAQNKSLGLNPEKITALLLDNQELQQKVQTLKKETDYYKALALNSEKDKETLIQALELSRQESKTLRQDLEVAQKTSEIAQKTSEIAQKTSEVATNRNQELEVKVEKLTQLVNELLKKNQSEEKSDKPSLKKNL
jgi:hypothetical protein